MKILLVCDDIPARALGGLGKHVVTLGNALLARGHEVTLMGRSSPSYEDCADEVGFKGPFVAGFPDPWKPMQEHRLGFYLPPKRPYFAKRIAEAILATAQDFDVIHYHGHLPLVGRYLRPQVPFLQTRHDQGSDCITHLRFKGGAVCTERDSRACASCRHPSPGPVRTWLSSQAVDRYRRETAEAFERHPVVFVSDFLRRNYQITMPETDLRRSEVVHNFVDEERLGRARGAPQTRSSSGLVLHIAGRLEPSKGIAAVVLGLLPKMPADWRIQVFGDGPDRQRLTDAHDARLLLLGHQPLDRVIAATAAADVAMVPSVCEESCGTVVLEALRLGKPCYALARGGTPELASYGAPGQLRLFDDMPSLIAGVLDARKLPMAYDMVGDSASVQARLNELLSLYERVRRAS